MCIIILNKKNLLSKEHFKNSQKANNDGFGMAYIVNNELKTYKTIAYSWKDNYKHYLKIRNQTDKPILLHFRFATHGEKTLKNTHPFFISDVAMVHNGIIDIDGDANKSDTVLFGELLEKLPNINELLLNDSFKKIIENYIGLFNKLAFLFKNGDYKIYNEAQGHWQNENWYSNYGYLDYPIGLLPTIKDKWADWRDDWTNGTVYQARECIFCGTTDNVEYSEDEGDFLCKECYNAYHKTPEFRY